MADIDTQFQQVVREMQALRTNLRYAPNDKHADRKRDRIIELTEQALQLNRVIRWRDREHTEDKRI